MITSWPVLVTNWTQFTTNFGEFVEGSYLAHAVYGYFLNGGGVAYIVRIGANGSNERGPGRTYDHGPGLDGCGFRSRS